MNHNDAQFIYNRVERYFKNGFTVSTIADYADLSWMNEIESDHEKIKRRLYTAFAKYKEHNTGAVKNERKPSADEVLKIHPLFVDTFCFNATKLLKHRQEKTDALDLCIQIYTLTKLSIPTELTVNDMVSVLTAFMKDTQHEMVVCSCGHCNYTTFKCFAEPTTKYAHQTRCHVCNTKLNSKIFSKRAA